MANSWPWESYEDWQSRMVPLVEDERAALKNRHCATSVDVSDIEEVESLFAEDRLASDVLYSRFTTNSTERTSEEHMSIGVLGSFFICGTDVDLATSFHGCVWKDGKFMCG